MAAITGVTSVKKPYCVPEMSTRMDKPKVGIIMGSLSDREVMAKAATVLRELDIDLEMVAASAHRTPDRVREYATLAQSRGVEVIIAGAGWAAHLAGAIASLTELPVIAVPIASSPLNGLDALLSSVQMPPGVPVATMAIDGAGNAGLFAAQILALKYPEIRQRLREFRKRQTEQVLDKARELEQSG
jgi:5-(carboxyamino)imidazole ribonucleotide mutase